MRHKRVEVNWSQWFRNEKMLASGTKELLKIIKIVCEGGDILTSLIQYLFELLKRWVWGLNIITETVFNCEIQTQISSPVWHGKVNADKMAAWVLQRGDDTRLEQCACAEKQKSTRNFLICRGGQIVGALFKIVCNNCECFKKYFMK